MDSADMDSPDKAPEFPTGLTWFNTDRPLRLADLRGRFVLLDFWTACSINCTHVIPELRQLAAKYPHELVIVGVHSGKFPHELQDATVQRAILRSGLSLPVVNDREFKIWKAYDVGAWPSLMLIDPMGEILGSHSGEGIFDLFDMVMTNALKQFDDNGHLQPKPLVLSPETAKRSHTILSFPAKVASDRPGKRLFIIDSGHNRILITDPDGHIEDVIGSGKAGKKDGGFSSATFLNPQGACLVDDILYIADTDNHLIRAADFNTRKVRTVFGTGEQASVYNKGGYGTAVALNSPWDICEADGKLYITMHGPHQLWEADLNMLRLEPYAGSSEHGRLDGKLLDAKLAQPAGITSDGIQLYFADSDTSAIRSADIDPDGRVGTLIGEDLFEYGDVDGDFTVARLQFPIGVVHHEGKLYVADTYNNKIKILDPLARQIRTFAGSGVAGWQDGPATTAQFYEPRGLAAANGVLYVADTNNHLIRTIDLASGTVGTVVYSNFTALSPDRGEDWSGRTVTLDEVTVMSGTAMLCIELGMPEMYMLNPDAPAYIDWSAEDEALVRFSSNAETIDVDPGESPMKFRIVTNVGVTALNIEAIIYYKRKDHPACLVDLVRARVPIRIVEKGEPDVQIVVPLDVKTVYL